MPQVYEYYHQKTSLYRHITSRVAMVHLWRKRLFLKASAEGYFVVAKLILPMVNRDVDLMLAALFAAAENNHKRVVSILIDAGTPMDEYDAIGYTPLHLAALSANKSVMKTLLGKGVDIDSASRGRLDTALHLLAGGRTAHLSPQLRMNAFQVLLDAGADINYRNVDGDQALIHAIWHVYKGVGSTNYPVAEALINAGANVLLENRYGDTPLSWARLHEIDRLVDLLVEAENKVNVAVGVTSDPLPGPDDAIHVV